MTAAGVALRRISERLGPRQPAQFMVLGFAGAIATGTGLLLLPISKGGNGGATFMEAFFTGTSAVSVTGLVVVDTPAFWTPFGHGVILIMIAIGGFGVMAFASVLGLVLARKMGLAFRISTAAETKSVGFGDIKQVVLGVLKTSTIIEACVAVILTVRFMIGYDETFGDALWLGTFHAVSAFNNAGFALFSDSLMSFAGDPWIVLPVAAAVVLGGLGFPVIFELCRRFQIPHHWSMNTKLVLSGTALLLFVGTVFITLAEWSNPETMAGLPVRDKLLAGFFQSAMTRTAGFNSLDIAEMHQVSWLAMDMLMFIGGGPAGTAGGLKVTTFAVLFFIIYTEIRGETSVNIFGKRLSRSVHRQAITVVLLSVALVAVSTMALMVITEFRLDRVLFEAVSAFATVGLSTGITADLPAPGQLILIMLMFVGRLGPITFATALALRTHRRMYELPKERPIIG